MVTGWDGVGLATLVLVIVLIWRVWVVENALHERVDDIDASLGGVVGLIIEKIDNFSTKMPEISLINQNPIGQIIDFLKGNAPDTVINSPPKDRDSTGQFVEVVQEHGTTEKEQDTTT
jgi:hypothetical protein